MDEAKQPLADRLTQLSAAVAGARGIPADLEEGESFEAYGKPDRFSPKRTLRPWFQRIWGPRAPGIRCLVRRKTPPPPG